MKNLGDLAIPSGVVVTFYGLGVAEWAAVFGVLFSAFTLLINWYYKKKEYELKEKALKHQIELKELKNEPNQTHR